MMIGNLRKFLFWTLISGLTVSLVGCGQTAAPKPTGGGLHTIGFYTEEQTVNPPPPFRILQAYPHAIDYLAPFWYSVNPDGTITSTENPKTAAFARKHAIKLVPLFTNANGNYAFLESPAIEKTAINNIVNLVVSKNYNGASIDFQLLPASARQGLSTFAADLAGALKAKGKEISADVIPADTNQGVHAAYDYATLAKYVHRIILMTYDNHYETSVPGPVAPLPWVRVAVQTALKNGVPPNQILLGLATYGYDWTTSGGTAIPLKNVKVLLRTMKITPTWDPVAMEYHFTYNDTKGTLHTVWYEDERALNGKITLARVNKLYGVAVWRVGYEDTAYWAALEKLLGRTRK